MPTDAITLATEPTPSALSAGEVAAVPAPVPAGAAAPAGPPKARSLADDILGDLYSLQPVMAPGGGR